MDLSLSEVANKNYSKKWPTEGLSFLGRLRQFNEGVCIMAYAKEATKRGGFEDIRVAMWWQTWTGGALVSKPHLFPKPFDKIRQNQGGEKPHKTLWFWHHQAASRTSEHDYAEPHFVSSLTAPTHHRRHHLPHP